jgi:hypothetical protein
MPATKSVFPRNFRFEPSRNFLGSKQHFGLANVPVLSHPRSLPILLTPHQSPADPLRRRLHQSNAGRFRQVLTPQITAPTSPPNPWRGADESLTHEEP